jgi:peptidoglycan/LPS O-acetylase OafA/YrhL
LLERSLPMNQFRYRPEIDGLRAVAVLAVLLYHANRAIPGGYTGVDVFFVISGFLITSLVRKDLAAETFRLAEFWERRVRRIFPALAFMVGVVLATGIVFMLPTDLNDLARSATAQSLLYSNFYFWSTIDYFSGPAELKPLLHTWSLAVEEQFYVVFPVLLVACRRWRPVTTLGTVALLALASFLLSVWGTHAYPQASFFLLPARAWELLAGALVALAPPRAHVRRWLCELGSGLGLAAIGAAYFLYDETTHFPGWAAALPCAGTAAIIYCNSPHQTFIGKGLAQKPLVAVGLISYSLYLWHWPIFAFFRYLVDENMAGWHCVLAAGAGCIVACLSWKFVELPFRHRREASSRARVFSTALSVSALLLAVSAVCWRTGGLPRRFSREFLNLAIVEGMPDKFKMVEVRQIVDGQLPILGEARDGERPSFLLWGDSHSLAISPLLDDLARQHGVFGYMASSPGTVPLLGTWRPAKNKISIDWNRAVIQFIRRKEIRNVILASRWSVNIEGRPNGAMDSLIADAQSREMTTAESKQVLSRGFEKTIGELRRSGVKVWIMKQVPEQKENARRALVRAALLRGMSDPQRVSLAEHRRRQANVDEVLVAYQADDVQLLDPADYCFDSSGTSLIGDGVRSYYEDENHLAPSGAARLLRRLFEPGFAQFASGSSSLARNTRTYQ